jgi:hypothetical protein
MALFRQDSTGITCNYCGDNRTWDEGEDPPESCRNPMCSSHQLATPAPQNTEKPADAPAAS